MRTEYEGPDATLVIEFNRSHLKIRSLSVVRPDEIEDVLDDIRDFLTTQFARLDGVIEAERRFYTGEQND